MKKATLILFCLVSNLNFSQSKGDIAAAAGIAAAVGAITIVAADADKKEMAKEITQFRSKEYIINEIIGPSNGKKIKFETESLASDNSAGLISVAFNCNEVDERGLLLAFFGENVFQGRYVTAYAFRYIPLVSAQNLLKELVNVKNEHKKYLMDENDVNNVFFEFEDIKFILYRDGGDQIRVLWNGFEVVWESTAFNRTQRRLDRWFE